jgi:hypothetical protein
MNDTYMRLLSTKEVNALVKEAKRVKYIVNESRDFRSHVEVLDDANNALVFKALRWNRRTWHVTFSKTYWQSPADAAIEGPR